MIGEPGHAERILVIDRHAPFEMAAKIKAHRPQEYAAHSPQCRTFRLALAHALVDEAVIELVEIELQMLRRIGLTLAAQAHAPVVVHPFEMHRIDGVLLALKPVAGDVGNAYFNEAVLARERFIDRQLGRWKRAHIDPDQSAKRLHRIGLDLALLAQRIFRIGGILIGLADAIAILVEQPAVIVAADALFLDKAIGQVGAAMRTMPVHHAESAREILIERQVLAKQADGLDLLVIEFADPRDRYPVVAQIIAHRRAGANLRDHPVAFGCEHCILPLPHRILRP